MVPQLITIEGEGTFCTDEICRRPMCACVCVCAHMHVERRYAKRKVECNFSVILPSKLNVMIIGLTCISMWIYADMKGILYPILI